MMSRSDMMPATPPALSTGTRADLALRQQGDRVAHRRVAVDGQDLAPLADWRIAAMVIVPLPSLVTRIVNAIWGLDDPMAGRQMEAMPRHDPVPRTRRAPDFERAAVAWARYKRTMKWMALAAVVTVLLALIYLKSFGEPVPIHMMIATIAGRRPHRAGRHRADGPRLPLQPHRP